MASSPTDPQENPTGTGHLPVSGEGGVPLTYDTSEDVPEASDSAPE